MTHCASTCGLTTAAESDDGKSDTLTEWIWQVLALSSLSAEVIL